MPQAALGATRYAAGLVAALVAAREAALLVRAALGALHGIELNPLITWPVLLGLAIRVGAAGAGARAQRRPKTAVLAAFLAVVVVAAARVPMAPLRETVVLVPAVKYG